MGTLGEQRDLLNERLREARERTVSLPDDLHPATKLLVMDFASAIAAKLRADEEKYGFTDQWAKPDWETDCLRQLREHLDKGDPLDVAIYAAFMWKHGWSTAEYRGDEDVDAATAYADGYAKALEDCDRADVAALVKENAALKASVAIQKALVRFNKRQYVCAAANAAQFAEEVKTLRAKGGA